MSGYGLAGFKTEKTLEMLPGLTRTTLAYNAQIFLCHFSAKKGVCIDAHTHFAAQCGYVISGAMEVCGEEGTRRIIRTEESYFIGSAETHGLRFSEDTELIGIFTPMRTDLPVK